MKYLTSLLVVMVCGFVVLFTLCLPVHAQFTPVELESLEDLRHAMRSTLTLIHDECGKVENASPCRDVIQGFYELSQAMGWLLHVNVNPNDAAGNALLAPFLACTSDCQDERQPVVNAAMADLSRSVVELNKASVFAGIPAYDFALQHIADVNRALPYALPLPPKFPKQFGPHGDYPNAQSTLWSVAQYGNSALRAWFDGTIAGAFPPCPEMVQHYALALERALVDTWLMSAHLVVADDEFSLYQTLFVQNLPDGNVVKDALTELQLVNGPTTGGGRSVVDHLRLVGEHAARCFQPTQPHLYNFLRRYADSWHHVDKWTGHFSKID